MVDTARVQVTREKKAIIRKNMAKIDAEYTAWIYGRSQKRTYKLLLFSMWDLSIPIPGFLPAHSAAGK